MAAEHHDAMAKVLRELPDRFGPTVFADRRRVMSMLSDRVPEARREIKVLGSAIDDGVFDTLSNARSEQIGLEIDRLAARFETNHGVRSDIALPVVRACAYGLGRGPLPSEYGGPPVGHSPPIPPQPQHGSWVGVSGPAGMGPAGPHSAPIPRHQPEGSWVGVSAPVGAPHGAPPPNPHYGAQMPQYAAHPGYSQQVGWPGGAPAVAAPGASYPAGPMAPPAKGGAGKWILIGVGAVAAILVGLYIIGSQSPQPTPTAKPAPAPPGPSSSPTPTPAPKAPEPQPSPKTSDPSPVTKPEREPTTAPTPPRPTPSPTPGPVAGTYGEETADFGVPPQRTLQANLGSPTPTGLPAGMGRVLSTQALDNEMRKGTDFLLIDVLEAPHQRTIIKARYIPYGGRAGSFGDLVQQQLVSELNTLTRGRTDYPIVFFCQGPRCWESYNALLRAYEAGYRNLYWYRGGLAAWSAAGLQMQPLPSR
ncbi:MAG TPA: rhodanese-like domain-containing protein [Vineibacter sp.]|nr:rhodanese-like domain-containing protein [Vineibacter sp.]